MYALLKNCDSIEWILLNFLGCFSFAGRVSSRVVGGSRCWDVVVGGGGGTAVKPLRKGELQTWTRIMCIEVAP